ncbi:DUF4271 domain-containing protein [Arundinibacter roseus]|uniref:DUF4271 domain-containing protein n=1 Tax=Arundinibacter roseus TaxID=2070510 RepID=A0A4R4KEA9_9BACT|nr:DUF4271 domain-containing protein [Arundinibacter roseus]TDB65132.1 DUF4271 domain-containing protein [Arundinibacter roseus]
MKLVRLLSTLSLVLIFSSFFSLSWAVNEIGPDKNHYLVYDYQHDWLTFSSRYKSFVPYSKGVNDSELSVSLLVDLSKYKRYDLLVWVANENYLFIEGALQQKLTADSWRTLNVDSLSRVYKKSELLLTLYGSSGIDGKKVLIGHSKKNVGTSEKKLVPGLSFINIKPIPTSPFEDYAIVVVVLILILTLFTYTSSPVTFRRFLSPKDLFDTSDRNDFYRFSKPYSRSVLLITLIVSMGLAYLILFFTHHKLDLFYKSGLLLEGETFAQLGLDQIKLTLLFIGLFFVKFIFMGVAGGVLNLENVINTHYIKSLQFSYLFYLFFILISFSLALQYPDWLEQAQSSLFYIFLIYYLIRFFLLYILLNNTGRIINLYLFSYLCVLEIIPLIIGVKYAL